jgi:hypothetical protein
MSSQLLGPTPLQSVIATSVTADQRLSVGPFGVGTVSLVETASAGGATLSLVDTAGAGASLPVLTFASAGGPPITSATVSASTPISLASASQSGQISIPLGAATIAVANTAITANSVVLFSPLSAPDATCVGIRVVLSAGVGFSLTGAANATAAVPLAWFVAKY